MMIKRSLKGEKLIVYILLCLGCFTISFNVAAASAAIPVISTDLGLPDFKVAAIIPYYLIPYGFGALLYAPLTSVIAYRSVYLIILGIYCLASIICAKALSLEVILLSRVAMGLSAAGIIPLGLMLIGEIFEKSIRGRLVGIFFGHAFIASIVGLLVGGLVNWRMIFYCPAILAGLLLVGFIVDRSVCLRKKHIGHINYIKAFKNKEILSVFVYIFILSFLYHGVHKWYGVYLSRVYQLDQLDINLFFIVTVVAGLVGQIYGGHLSDKIGRYKTTQIGISGLALGIMLLFGVYSKVILGAVLIVISLSWTVGHNGISTILTDFSDQDRPVIASLNSSIRFISGGLGFTCSRYFVENSFAVTFLGIGILILLLSVDIKKFMPQHSLN